MPENLPVSSITAFANTEVRHARNECASGAAHSSVVSPADFDRAIQEIGEWQGYVPTPLISLSALAREIGLGELLYKDESDRFALGSFKALGAAYATQCLLAREIGRRLGREVGLPEIRNKSYLKDASSITVACATAGNHGRSLAWGANRFGCNCVIYVHSAVSSSRKAAMEELGATVVRISGNYDNALRVLKRDAKLHGWAIVSDASWDSYVDSPREVMAGYGIMIHEILAQAPGPLTHVFLQCGVGSLAASVSAFLRQRVQHVRPRIIIVEPALASCAFNSILAGRNSTVNVGRETVMAGLSCGRLSELAWPVIKQEASDFLTIEDSVIAPAMSMLAKPAGADRKIVAGESAVAGLAAFLALRRKPAIIKALDLRKSSRCLFIGTEGATDLSIYQNLLQSCEYGFP